MKTYSLQINHPSELNSLLTPRLFRKSGRGTISLSPAFEHPQRELWQTAINRHYYACGCGSSAKGLLVTLLIGMAIGLAGYVGDMMSLKQAAALTLGGAAIGAAIGKWAGLASANDKLARVVHTVQAHWRPDDKEERPIAICG